MTAQEVTDCLNDISSYLQKTMPQDVPTPYKSWSEALTEAIEIIEDSKYWPDK